MSFNAGPRRRFPRRYSDFFGVVEVAEEELSDLASDFVSVLASADPLFVSAPSVLVAPPFDLA